MGKSGAACAIETFLSGGHRAFFISNKTARLLSELKQ